MTSTAELTSPSSANTPAISVLDNDYTLEHKYTRTDGRSYLSGVQEPVSYTHLGVYKRQVKLLQTVLRNQLEV